ncbi:adhesion G protein-coupled receptor A2 [Narcine bancroftii]|uniref:adhesion G protein-coupled receptor A2 n=1 Tax=Narcine bancroftii TaxID=1343680 RepID=UPI003831C40B
MPALLSLGLLLSLAGRAACCAGLLTNTCVCVEERTKGPASPQLRRKVVCSRRELVDVPGSSLLPNGTVHLILSNNKIVLLKTGTFSGLRALEKLDLRNNLISTIETGAFNGLTALKRLDLSNNRIGCLTLGMFQSLTSLTRLNLSGNIFSTLNPDLLDGLTSLKVIDFNTEFLFCDCNLLRVLNWERNSSARISEETICSYPKALQGKPFKDLKESQLVCQGPLELPFLQLIPVLRQVVFQGDRLPFLCTATYLDNSTKVLWYHNGILVQPEEENGIIIMDSLVHDCSLISSELILSNIYLLASGEWECVIATSRGNASLKVEIVVIDTSATYCQADEVTNNRGEFRWPRTLAGITVYQPCLEHPYPSPSSEERKTSRKCNRAGVWEEADYSQCLYINDYTRVLSSFTLMPINNTNVLPLAHKLLDYTMEATNFLDMMDVIYVAQMIEAFIGWTDEIHDLGDLIVEMASNMMQVDGKVLRLAQEESGACTRMVGAVEKIAGLTLTSNSQTISKVSKNIAVEAFLVKPASYVGLSCTAFQRIRLHGGFEGQEEGVLPPLQFRCSTGNTNSSLRHFPIKNSMALASVQLPPALFAHSPSPDARSNSSCWLQFVAFRNGKLFPSAGNSSNLADHGKERSPSTPIIFAGAGSCVGELIDPLFVSLRHWQMGEDQVAAHWNFDLLDGLGGWQAAGCHIAQTRGNISTLHCSQFSNVAVLKRISNQSVPIHENVPILHPIIYTCTVFLLLCLFLAIIAYILRHNTIRISRKSWHMLLNLWFHISVTCAVFTGGINRKEYGLVCQVVGIVLHYASLSTLLWIGVSARVIYKEATQKVQRQQELELPAPAQRPMLRFYLIAGGIPLIICGITAAVNLQNYSNVSPYCWLAWKPSLGAFYVPAGFTILVSWIYFLGASLHLGCHQRGKGETQGLEEQPVVSSGHLADSASTSFGPWLGLENVYSLDAQLWALLSTQLLFISLWTFGALSVSQGLSWAALFSCLYGVGAVSLGLLVLIHHCLKRHDVCGTWLPCAKGPGGHAGSLMAGSSLEAAQSSGTNPFTAGGQCKLTNIQAALSQGERAVTTSPSLGGESEREAPACRSSVTQTCRSHRARTTPPADGKHQRARALRVATSSDAASSENGSIGGGQAESRPSRPSREGSTTMSEGSDTSSPGHSRGLQASLEKEAKRRSYPLNAANQNGTLRGSHYDVAMFGGEGGAAISAGLWKSETTV